MIKRLALSNVGPIASANVSFGDLTVLVGPQASGNSIFLEWLQLVEEMQYSRNRLRQYGVEWNGSLGRLLETCFGEGRGLIWRAGSGGSTIEVDGEQVQSPETRLARGEPRRDDPSAFGIPAQRAVTTREGWPRPFSDFGPGDPFAVRGFSDRLRILLGHMSSGSSDLFPKTNKLKAVLRKALDDAVFRGFGLRVDRSRPQRRLVFGKAADKRSLPFMTWSAGQREFVPLLLGLYWLLPPAKIERKPGVNWEVIEEPDMGLHTRGIGSAMLFVLDLLRRGYRVCISTHSQHVLDILRGLRAIQQSGGDWRDVLDLSGLGRSPSLKPMADTAIPASRAVLTSIPEACHAIYMTWTQPRLTMRNEAGAVSRASTSGSATLSRGSASSLVPGKASQVTPVEPYVKTGKDAVKGEHRDIVSAARGRLVDSANLEDPLGSLSPADPQWDHAIGWVSSEEASCCFVEVHRANMRQADDVLRKKTAATQALEQHAPGVLALSKQTRLRTDKPGRWITTDAHVGIHPNTPAARRLREAGISMPSRHLMLQ